METQKEGLKNHLQKYEVLNNTKKEDLLLLEIGKIIKKATSSKNIIEAETLLDLILETGKRIKLKKRLSLLSQFSFSIVN